MPPSAPGVYFLIGDDAELLYIGKAANLQTRLRSYAPTAKHGRGPKIDRLISLVRDVRWEECPSAAAALAREADLVVALKPRFNSAMVGDDNTMIALVLSAGTYRIEALSARTFQGASRVRREEKRFGAFLHLGVGKASYSGTRTTDGFAAFLRLLWTADKSAPDGRMPSRLLASPPRAHEGSLDPTMRRPLIDLLAGRSGRLIDELARAGFDHMPPYMRPALLRDAESARAFYDLGPRPLASFRRRHGLPKGPVDPATIRRLLLEEVGGLIGYGVSVPAPADDVYAVMATTRVPSRLRSGQDAPDDSATVDDLNGT